MFPYKNIFKNELNISLSMGVLMAPQKRQIWAKTFKAICLFQFLISIWMFFGEKVIRRTPKAFGSNYLIWSTDKNESKKKMYIIGKLVLLWVECVINTTSFLQIESIQDKKIIFNNNSIFKLLESYSIEWKEHFLISFK